MPGKLIPAIVLGAGGYVGAEFVRLISGHPSLRLEAAVSESRAGGLIADTYPHLSGLGDLSFVDIEHALEAVHRRTFVAVFSALPHGEAARLLLPFLECANASVVDVSADFRLADADAFAKVYKHEHGAPERFSEFLFGLPDLTAQTPERHASHPGCFTTCVTLGAAPLMSLLDTNHLTISAVTGSTGAGRQAKPGTHHPERHSGLWAYEPIRHRHVPEMKRLLATEGSEPEILFVPHSGPFSRGMLATIFGKLKAPMTVDALVKLYQEFYEKSPFISVGTRMPSVKEVVGSNRCHIGIAVQGDDVVVTSVIDNLVKGAAGGGIQWMNRILGLPQETGLMTPGPGWV